MPIDDLLKLLTGFHASRVVVLGDVMLDRFVYGVVQRISPEAPIPVLRVERRQDMPGGAANVARNLASLGARAMLLGVTGNDPEADDLGLQLAGTPTIDACLLRDDARPTTVKTRFVAEGQQVLRTDREVALPLSPAVSGRLLAGLSAALPEARAVILSDYAKGTLCEATTRAAIEQARRAGKVVIVDPKSRDFGKYRGATVITPNQGELQLAWGRECVSDDQVVEAARHFLNQGVCDSMVVTRGKHGMSVIERDARAQHLPAQVQEVFDVSGAGDTVAAVLALGLSAGAPLPDAARLANVAAGIVVGKRGTATVTSGEIMAALLPIGAHTDPQKVHSLDAAQQLARVWRDQGLKIAFTNGCFDLLHPGHISLLEFARRSADRLIVGLNADLSIRRLKGPERPIQGEAARAAVLSAVKSVDAVVIFADDTPIELIRALVPDVLVKGADYRLDAVVGADFVVERGGRVLLAPLLAGHSTSDTVQRAARSAGS